MKDIPPKALQILDRLTMLMPVIIPSVIAIVVITATWTILTSTGFEAIFKIIGWVQDIIRLGKIAI
jgi:hypothetical protein